MVVLLGIREYVTPEARFPRISLLKLSENPQVRASRFTIRRIITTKMNTSLVWVSLS